MSNKILELPSGRLVMAAMPIISGGHFDWGEATHKLKRQPATLPIEINIEKAAYELEKVRELLGNQPIFITSWYRPKKENKLAGGSQFSRHLYGDGVDFYCSHIGLKKAYQILNKEHLKGGLARYRSHIHIDFRGTKARW